MAYSTDGAVLDDAIGVECGPRHDWRRKAGRRRPGRPDVDPELRRLIRRVSGENPLWGAPRVTSELKHLGVDVSEGTVRKYVVRRRKPPSSTWRTFLRNHTPEIAAIDFLTVPTATFRVLYAFVVIAHDRRRILHVNVTDHPTAAWTAQQIAEAFPWDTAPRFLVRDRDRIYGQAFRCRVAAWGSGT